MSNICYLIYTIIKCGKESLLIDFLKQIQLKILLLMRLSFYKAFKMLPT